MKAAPRGWMASAVLLASGALGVPSLLDAQDTPPIGSTTGTMVLEGTVDQEYAVANTVVVKTIDGVKHVFHFTRRLLVHGGTGTGVDALPGLREGATVAVHYTGAGGDASAQEIDLIDDKGLSATEGTVIRIDRSRKHITIRFDNGKTELFDLTDRAAVDAGRNVDRATDGTTRVTVYYRDEGGRKVAHFFKKAS